MKKFWIAWIALGVLVGMSSTTSVSAQDMAFTEEEAESADTAPAEGEEASEEGAESSADFGDGSSDGDIIGDLAAEADTTPEESGDATPQVKEAKEDVFAVQQVYALRLNRVELAPSIGFTMNDPYVSHPSLNLALNYWWTNVLAVGVNFLWYQGLESESDLNFFTRRSTRLAIPITEWQFGAYLNFTYVPFYGKFSGFNKFIFQWDSYIVGGVGLMRTRPVPVLDPEIRAFDFGMRLGFNAGLGLRIFLTRYLTVFAEFRNYMFLDKFENDQVATGPATGSCMTQGYVQQRNCPDTWEDEGNTFTNAMTAQIGFTVYFPFTFEYKLPK